MTALIGLIVGIVVGIAIRELSALRNRKKGSRELGANCKKGPPV